MSESLVRSMVAATEEHLRNHDFAAAGDIWRHEGLKKFIVEEGLYALGATELGRIGLSQLGGGPVNDPRLRTNVAGIEMDGPTGVAPGWDKTGKTIQALQALGARHATVGGVPLYGQAGSQQPRLWTFDRQFGDHGTSKSLNCYGFWSEGAPKVANNVRERREHGEIIIPIFMQATLNKYHYVRDIIDVEEMAEAMAKTVSLLAPVADGISIGITSPNTTGMREKVYDDEFLVRILFAVANAIGRTGRKIPTIVKIDGDEGKEGLEYWCTLAQDRGEYFDGYEALNTTGLARIKAKYGAENVAGGLAGADEEYQQMMLEAIRYIYEEVGDKLDLIATGGLGGRPDLLLQAIKNGASAAGVNSGFREYGPGVIQQTEHGLVELIDGHHPDIETLDQLIGLDTKRGPKQQAREPLGKKSVSSKTTIH